MKKKAQERQQRESETQNKINMLKQNKTKLF